MGFGKFNFSSLNMIVTGYVFPFFKHYCYLQCNEYSGETYEIFFFFSCTESEIYSTSFLK